MKKKVEESEKLLNLKDIIKLLNLPKATTFVVSRVYKNSLFTEEGWTEELKKRKIL